MIESGPWAVVNIARKHSVEVSLMYWECRNEKITSSMIRKKKPDTYHSFYEIDIT